METRANMSFREAHRAHEYSKHGRFELHVVHDPGIESLFGICSDFSGTLAANGLDPEVIKVGRSELFRLRRLTTSLAMPFDHPEMHITEIRERLGRLAQDVNYAATKKHLETAISVCGGILANPSNPLEPKLTELAVSGAVVVTKDQSMRESLMRWLSQRYPSVQLQAAAIGDLRLLDGAARLIYLMSPTYASWRPVAPEWRFARDPKAMESHFIMYPFGEMDTAVPGLMPDGPPRRQISSKVPLQLPYFDATVDAETEWTVDERKAAGSNTGDQDELVPGKYVRLAGGFSTFLEADREATVFTVTKDTSGKLDVLKESVHALEADRFVVLRVEGTESDFIQDEADRLGAAQYRKSQRRWQEALKQARRNEGSLSRMRERLKTSYNLDNTGLLDWLTNPRRIGPLNYADFEKLCQYLQLSGECKALWHDLQEIRSHHRRAGAGAARTLRGLLETRDMSDPALQNPGFLIIDRGEQGLGKIGVYRILQIGEVHPVDAWRINAIERAESRGAKPVN